MSKLIFLLLTIFGLHYQLLCQPTFFPILDSGGHNGRIQGLFHLPGTSKVITVGEEGTIRSLDSESGKVLEVNTIFESNCKGCRVIGTDISSDSKLVALGGKIGEDSADILIIRLDDWKLLYTLHGHKDGVREIKFSQDGTLLVSGGQNGEIKIWDTQKYKVLQTLNYHDDMVLDIAVTRNGNQILSTAFDNTEVLWTKNIAGAYIPTALQGHDDYVISTVVAPDDSYFVSCDLAGKLIAWKLNGKKKWTNETFGRKFNSLKGLSFSADGSFLAIGEDYDLGSLIFRVLVLDTDELKVVNTFDGHKNTILKTIFLSNDQIVSVNGGDGATLLWNRQDTSIRYAWRSRGIAFRKSSFDENLSLQLGNNNLLFQKNVKPSYRFDWKNLNLDELSEKTSTPRNPIVYKGKKLKLVDKHNLEIVGGKAITFIDKVDGRIQDYFFTNHGNITVVGDLVVKLFDSQGKLLHNFSRGRPGELRGATVSSDDQLIAINGTDQKCELWNLESGQHLLTLFIEETGEWVVWSPLGYFHASEEGGKALRWYMKGKIPKAVKDIKTLKELYQQPDLIRKIIFTGKNDADLLVMNNKTISPIIRLGKYDGDTRQRQFNFRFTIESINGLKKISILHNETLILKEKFNLKGIVSQQMEDSVDLQAGKNNITIVIDNGKNKITQKVINIFYNAAPELIISSGHSSLINKIVFSHDGRYAASASNDNTVRIWDVNTGGLFRILNPSNSTEANFASFSSVAFHPSNSNILCASTRSQIFLFDISTEQIIKEYTDTDYLFSMLNINQLHYSKDGNFILFAGEDGRIKLWNIAMDRLESNVLVAPEGLLAMALTSDEKKIIVLSNSNQLMIVDQESFKITDHIDLSVPFVTNESFRKRGFLILDQKNEYAVVGAMNKEQVEVLDLATKETKYTIPVRAGSTANSATILSDNKVLAIGGISSPIRVFDFKTGEERFELGDKSMSAFALATHPHRNSIMSGHGVNKDFIVKSWLVEDAILEFEMGNYLPTIAALEMSRKGNVLASGGSDKSLIIWNLENLSAKFIRSDDNACNNDMIGIYDVAVSDSLVAASYCGNTIKLFDPYTGKNIYTLSLDKPARAIEFSTDGRYLGIATDDAQVLSIPEKRLTQLGSHEGSISDLHFSPDQKQIATVDHKEIIIWSLDDFQKLRSIPITSIFAREEQEERENLNLDANQGEMFYTHTYKFVFTNDGSKIILVGTDYGNIHEYIIKDGRQKLFKHATTRRLDEFISLAISPDGAYIAAGNRNQNTIEIFDVTENRLVHILRGHQGAVDELTFDPDGEKLLSSSKDGTIIIWDWRNELEEMRFISTSEGKYIIHTHDSYYTSNHSSIDAINFSTNNQIFEFEQFDIKLNRPDIVLSRLGFAKTPIYQAYKRAYLKRLEKMQLEETMLDLDFTHVPTCKVKLLENKQGIQTLEVLADGNGSYLNKIHLFINDVPITGRKGINVQNTQKMVLKKQFEIPLSPGRNKIQISALNHEGLESLKQTFYVTNLLPATKPTLFLYTIGISKYDDPKQNLKYADKDATDIAQFMESSGTGIYEKVIVKSFLNEDFDSGSLQKIQLSLNQTKVGDCVIIFYAGHGSIDNKFNYYLGTSRMNFDTPSKNGLLYEDLENLLDGIPARKKLLLVDACHAGEVDIEYLEKVKKANLINHDDIKVTFRIVGDSIFTYRKLGLENAFEMMKKLFVDLRRGTGATVIASASGVEFAQEGDQWKNGVFTYILLKGLKEMKADLNGDDQISVSELQLYLSKTVSELTDYHQRPTTRVENVFNDWQVW